MTGRISGRAAILAQDRKIFARGAPHPAGEDRDDMPFKPKSAAETKAAALASAIVRAADADGAPLRIGIDRLRQGNPRLTPLAIGQMVRRHRDIIDAVLSERGYHLLDYSDQGPGRGMEFEIGPA
jgi:hypothetical protein